MQKVGQMAPTKTTRGIFCLCALSAIWAKKKSIVHFCKIDCLYSERNKTKEEARSTNHLRALKTFSSASTQQASCSLLSDCCNRLGSLLMHAIHHGQHSSSLKLHFWHSTLPATFLLSWMAAAAPPPPLSPLVLVVVPRYPLCPKDQERLHLRSMPELSLPPGKQGLRWRWIHHHHHCRCRHRRHHHHHRCR